MSTIKHFSHINNQQKTYHTFFIMTFSCPAHKVSQIFLYLMENVIRLVYLLMLMLNYMKENQCCNQQNKLTIGHYSQCLRISCYCYSTCCYVQILMKSNLYSCYYLLCLSCILLYSQIYQIFIFMRPIFLLMYIQLYQTHCQSLIFAQ